MRRQQSEPIMSDKPKITYGPSNPHPLSQMRTELVWEGKYDEFGNRREVNVASYSMPLQLIETIDEPRSRMQAQGSFFDTDKAHRDDFRNKLIWGDNKLALASLVKDFQGGIDLIYIDPPFDVGADFRIKMPIGDKTDKIEKEPSIIETVAYSDTWGRGIHSYLQMIQERLQLAKNLLSDTGTIYLHCDYRVNFLLRSILDEIFGRDCFRSEVVWCYKSGGAGTNEFAKKHDTIFAYSRSDTGWIFNTEKEKSYVARSGNKAVTYFEDENGTYTLVNRKDWWVDIGMISTARGGDRIGYPTEKPEDLLSRIIQASSNPNSIVLDFFAGSGTTLAAAERLGRRWIGVDIGRFAIHTMRKRLIDVQRDLNANSQPYRSFDVFNLGRYERQWWQQEALRGAEDEHRNVVLGFFKAEPLPNAPSPLIHGRKATAFIHIDGIDSIFSREEAKAVALAVKAAGGKQVHCLAWDFEMDIRQAIAGIESELGIKFRLHRIPREIMEKNRTEVPPFFEVALLEAEPVIRKGPKGKTVEIKLKNFLPSLTEVPSKELDALQERALTSGFDFIDFWAIDFDWMPGKPFSHHWQDFRTRNDRSLKTVSDADFAYNNPGKYTACIKVVDVFGCDTSITVEIEV
jgi:adenine-specific DNA-methyltransferase